MAYSDLTLSKFKTSFDVYIEEDNNLFADIKPLEASEKLKSDLKETAELALAINTEKARSEMIILPILLEIRRRSNYQISLFTGTNFDVDVEKENANSRQELDAETFDDGELYHILLKELLESGAGSGGHLQAGMQARSASKKKKKQVDRKASKVCECGLQ